MEKHQGERQKRHRGFLMRHTPMTQVSDASTVGKSSIVGLLYPQKQFCANYLLLCTNYAKTKGLKTMLLFCSELCVGNSGRTVARRVCFDPLGFVSATGCASKATPRCSLVYLCVCPVCLSCTPSLTCTHTHTSPHGPHASRTQLPYRVARAA